MGDELCRVAYIDLPCKVHGLTVYHCEDGQTYYTIIINARDSVERQLKTINHELNHVRNGDIYTMIPVQELELLRHDIK